MSEHITHIAVYEDCARMVLNSEKFCEYFRTCVKNHYDSGMLTSGSRGNHLFAVPILESFKDRKELLKSDPEAGMKVTGALGWITHRAADLQMKPTWRKKEAEDPGFPASEMQIYHDAVTFREVYNAGGDSTSSPYEVLAEQTLEPALNSHPAAGMFNVSEVEKLLSFLFQSEFASLHTYNKQEQDIDQWLDDTIEYHQEFSEDLRIYIEAFNNPEPSKMRSYVTGINYYDPEDPLIIWVRAAQQGHSVDPTDLDKALDAAEHQSHYAQALRKGFNFLYDANRYFMNEISKNQLYDTLQIVPANRF